MKEGNERQKKAYEIISKYQIFKKLQSFSPILAGTIPIGIDIPGSDLDIICEIEKEEDFVYTLHNLLPENTNFTTEKEIIGNEDCIILNTVLDELPVEVFGQKIPSTKQNAYRHMIAEYKILKKEGEEFKQKIIEFKKNGIKTELAFGILLQLENPYEDLLKM
ncbi:DUF4269 domain-containing protein [Chryseobacterium sp.]|uniref:DUF4269 domain-containing protein n=1 Tax=Chryseobacterium sp. TaxID=1871047 RepID=UPI0025B8A6F2|nr:DUF4269 domain-containing protein [Chryseobacterium sp.]